MAKQKIVWIDNQGAEYLSEAAADRANLRLKAEDVLSNFGVLPTSGLWPLEGANHQALEPLHAYITMLMTESMDWTEKHG